MSETTNPSEKIMIIGGGAFGLSIGWYLARAGRLVTILDRGQELEGATWAAAGMLMPWRLSKSFSQQLFNLQQASHRLWPRFAAELNAAADISLHYQTRGRYFVALNEKAAARLRRQYEYHSRVGFPLEWLSGAEARHREPELGPQLRSAIFSPLAHWVDNRRLVLALRQVFRRAGGELRWQTTVKKILVTDGRVCGVQLVDETKLMAGTVVVAAGAWSGQIEGLPSALQTAVQPLKGQTLILQMAPDRPLLCHPVIGPVYLVPRRDGQLLLGTTFEHEAGFDLSPTAAGVFFMLKKAQQIVPGVKNLPLIEMGAGLRPTAPARRPVLGPANLNGLVMASGGHANGILLSPVVAQTISHQLLTGRLPAAIKPFLPSG